MRVSIPWARALVARVTGVLTLFVVLSVCARAELVGRYVINLQSSAEPVRVWNVPRRALYERYRLYSLKAQVDGKIWQRLRLGFFPDRRSAQAILRQVARDFPGAWIARVTQREKTASAAAVVKPGAAPSTTARVLPVSPANTPLPATGAAARDALAPKASSASPPAQQRRFALDLTVSRSPPTPDQLPKLAALRKYHLYTLRAPVGNQQIYHLQLGFFASAAAAGVVADTLREAYPQVQVVPVTEREQWASRNAALLPGDDAGAGPAESTVKSGKNERARRIFVQARKAMTAGDYPRAVQLFTALLQEPGHEFQRDAQELLGLARERNGQLAHAKAEYETYLRLYPDGSDAARVRQRLAGVLTANRTPAPAPRETPTRTSMPRWDWFGSLSQFYWHDTDFTEQDEEIVRLSELSTFALVSGRRRSDDYDLKTRVAIDNRHDYVSEEDDSRLLEAYIDGLDRRRNIFGRAGRQTRRSGGVFGRFDGLYGGYQLGDTTFVNLVAGKPVDSFDTGLDIDKTFVGVGADIGTLAEHWDLSVFFIEQQADGILDRRALGTELSYVHPRRSLFALFDYDLSYEKLNVGFLTGTWTSRNGTSFYVSVDQRASPLLSTSNAMLGQAVTSLDELADTFSEQEIRELALDRTADTRSFTLGGSGAMRRDLQIAGDITLAELDATVASGGVEAIPASEDRYYSVQFIRKELFVRSDLTILSLRYADTETAAISTFSFDWRVPLREAWRISPRIQLDLHDIKDSNNRRDTLEVGFRADYRRPRRFRFQFEVGAAWSDEEIVEQQQDTRRIHANLGYYLDFD